MSIISESENIAMMTANHYERILLERDDLAALLAAEKATRNSIIEKAVQTQRERDEARAERDILKLDAQREAEHHDRIVGELEKVYKERDEAREKAERYRLEANALMMQRDEAREQNAKLRDIADALAVALERLDVLYRSEQDPEAPMPRPDWLRRPLQMLDAELDQLKEGAK
jgi:chromosome segregation ATPase